MYLFQKLRALQAKSSTLEIVQIDLQQDDYIREAVKMLEARLSSHGLNLLVNNAGTQHKVSAYATSAIPRLVVARRNRSFRPGPENVPGAS